MGSIPIFLTQPHNDKGEHGFQLLNGKGSNFALLGTPGSSLLGAGAYGHVYKAIHFPTMRRVAIKKIPKDFGRTNDFTNSFARELRNLYSNVRKITDVTKSARTVQENDGGHCPFLLTLYDAYVEKNPTNLCLVRLQSYYDGRGVSGGSGMQNVCLQFVA